MLTGRPAGGVVTATGSGIGAEEALALRRELRAPGDHAGLDAIDVGNLGAAQAERIGLAGRLLFGGIGMARASGVRRR